MEDTSMSFNLNPLNNNTPSIRTSKTQDGGAGNTGYFQQQQEKKEKEERNKNLFGESKDTITLSDAAAPTYQEPPILVKIVEFAKSLLHKMYRSLFYK